MQRSAGSDPDPLAPRRALDRDAAVPSRLLREYGDADPAPQLTIAVPTWRRPALLRAALASALAQDTPDPIEILVVDNDPDSNGAASDGLPEPHGAGARQLRHFVNAENIGMFGNWNRALSLARGHWFAILNDDDLLDPEFARTMLAALRATGAPDALICRKRTLDMRAPTDRVAPGRTGGGRVLRAALRRASFRGRAWRPITARHLFWGNTIGNSVGLVCRTADLRGLGGFDPGDYPSADYYVHARLATHYRLGQVDAVLASIRLDENESMKPETLYGFLRTGYRMQQALAGRHLPAWWARLSPALMAWHVEEVSRQWHVAIDRLRVEGELGIALPPPRERVIKALRVILGGV